MVLLGLALLLAPLGAGAAPGRLPHILFVIVDDFGWAEVGYHRKKPIDEVRTPHIDELVKAGVELNRHYVHMMCTPSRSSFQSGRLPAHLLLQLAGPCDREGAIPRNMTGLAAVLKRAGYATHQVGKWDAGTTGGGNKRLGCGALTSAITTLPKNFDSPWHTGMVTPHHTPKGRGYDTSLTYFSHGNWMYSEAEWLGSYNNRPDVPEPGIIDLWDTDRPARSLNGTGYEELIFRDRMLQILRAHNQSRPLFLQYDSKVAHYPLQAPLEYQDRFRQIEEDHRRVYHSMINFLDDQLANITGTMKELGMWENTLMVLSSDNGGYVGAFDGTCNTTDAPPEGASPSSDVGHGTTCFNGEAGGNNYPLRGGKYSNFEGGIRVNAFLSGGYLPERVRGTRHDGMMHIADWYRTLAEGVAGVDPTDVWAAKSGLPPIDSLNMWPMLLGEERKSPRESIATIFHQDMLIMGQWKYVRGNTVMIEASWGGPQYPNASTAWSPIGAFSFRCPPAGCLFDVVSDPTEHHEVSDLYPSIAASLQTELSRQAAGIWRVDHKDDPVCRKAARSVWGGFFGPWKELEALRPPDPLLYAV